MFVDGEAGLAVLADGMGGYSAGEVASGIAVNVISKGMLQEIKSGRELNKVDVSSGLTHAALLLQQIDGYAAEIDVLKPNPLIGQTLGHRDERVESENVRARREADRVRRGVRRRCGSEAPRAAKRRALSRARAGSSADSARANRISSGAGRSSRPAG